MKAIANLEAEEALIGAMLLSAAARDTAVEEVRPEHFYKPAHGDIFAAIARLHAKREPVDPITVSHAMEQDGTLSHIGGSGTLVALVSIAPAAANAKRYARVVAELHQLRQMENAGREAIALARSIPENVPAALASAERSFAEIGTDLDSDDLLFKFADVSNELIERYLRLVEGDRTDLGPTTGLACLDDILDGLAPGSLTIIGGRPGMGKTVLGCVMARHIAVRLGLTVPFWSLEVPRIELGMRLVAAHCDVDYGRLKLGQLHEAEWARMIDREPTLSHSGLHIVDDSHATVAGIERRARRLRRETGSLGAIVIDYVQLMDVEDYGEGRRVALDSISRGLKVLARDLGVPVIALAQLNRGVESRADKRPMLSDLREAGGLEQDADNVIFCYRDEVYDRESQDQGIIELIVAKHRTGQTGTARAAWLGHRQDIRDMGR